MGGLDGCRGGGGRLSLVVLVSEKPNLVREKSGNFIYLWCWQPCCDLDLEQTLIKHRHCISSHHS